MKVSKAIKFIGCVGLASIFLVGCSNTNTSESNKEVTPIVNLSEQELEKYEIIDVVNIDSKITKVEDEEAIIYTLTYKNTSERDLIFEPSLGVINDSMGGFTGPDDGYSDRFDNFLKKRGLTLDKFEDSDFSDYKDEFLKEVSIALKPNQEETCSFTIKKSELLRYSDSESNEDISIEELLSNPGTALNYSCMYGLDDKKYVSVEYTKYPNKEVQKNGYIDSYN